MALDDYLENQHLLRIAALLIMGIVAGDVAGAGVDQWLSLALMALSLVAFLIAGRRHPYLQSAFILMGVFFFGFSLIGHEERSLAFPFQDGERVDYEGVVTSKPRERGKTLQFDLALTAVGRHSLSSPINVKASLLRDTITGRWRTLRLGSGVRCSSEMSQLANYYADSNFDYVRWLKAHGFSARTFILPDRWQRASVQLAAMPRFSRLRLRAMQWRERLAGYVFGSDEDDQGSAIIAAMVLGDKQAVSDSTKEAYSISGASHVLALSGLHLSVIYAILTMLLSGLRRWTWLSQALVLSAVWVYVVIVGMGPSVVRSAVMLSVYSLCVVTHREKASVNALSFAAICLLVANPLSLWDVGFQMSFMAVMAIVVGYRPVYRLLKVRGRLMRALWGTAVVSLTAQAGTAPLIAYYFGRFSCYFLITNFIAVPAATVIIYGAAFMFLLSPLPSAASLIASALRHMAGWLNDALSWIASLPGACIDNINMSLWQVYLIYILMACVAMVAYYLRKMMLVAKVDGASGGKSRAEAGRRR